MWYFFTRATQFFAHEKPPVDSVITGLVLVYLREQAEQAMEIFMSSIPLWHLQWFLL